MNCLHNTNIFVRSYSSKYMKHLTCGELMYICRYMLHTTYIQRKRRMGEGLCNFEVRWKKDRCNVTLCVPARDSSFSKSRLHCSPEFLVGASWRLEQAGLCLPICHRLDHPENSSFHLLDIRISLQSPERAHTRGGSNAKR